MTDFSNDPLAGATDKAIEEAAKVAKDYADKLFSPTLEQLGGVLSDRLAFWRFKNRIELILKAKAFLESKGIEPRRVLPKVAAPIIEAGSLEDEGPMREKWAAMLARAANPDEPELLPSLPRMLAELSYREVRVLDELCRRHGYRRDQWNHIAFESREFAELVGDDVLSVILMENLLRLRIVEPGQGSDWIGKEKMEDPFLISMLGLELINACRFP